MLVIDYLAWAMSLFERAERTKNCDLLPDGLPVCWEDMSDWISANGWGHPGGIPPPTLERFCQRLQQRLDEADPTETEINHLLKEHENGRTNTGSRNVCGDGDGA